MFGNSGVSLVMVILYVVVFIYEVVYPSMLVRLIIKVGGVLWWLVFLQHFIVAYRTLLPHMMGQHRASDEEIVLIFDTIGQDYNVILTYLVRKLA